MFLKEYCVYMLRCSDNTYYTGVTNDIERRFNEHIFGYDANSYTFKRRPLTIVFTQSFKDIEQAIAFEKRLKKWSKKKKEALINQDFEKLPGLAKKNFGK